MEQYLDMAEHSFGFGTWEAPYWFLGPEQGMSKDESKLDRRYAAWKKLGSRDLDDCVAFHHEINDPTWHRERPKPQFTWTRLISTLIGYGADGVVDRRIYQRDHWGRHQGQGIDSRTCVIELSGLAAQNQHMPRDRSAFLASRIAMITANLRKYKPELLILYGRSGSCKQAWNEMTSTGNELGQCSNGATVRQVNGTILAWTDHTNARGFGRSLAYWQAFGTELRNFQQRAA